MCMFMVQEIEIDKIEIGAHGPGPLKQAQHTHSQPHTGRTNERTEAIAIMYETERTSV